MQGKFKNIKLSKLCKAAQDGNLEDVRNIIAASRSRDENPSVLNLQEVLNVAIEYAHFNVVKYIIEAYRKDKQLDVLNMALNFCAKLGKLSYLKDIIDTYYSKDTDAKFADLDSALLLAIKEKGAEQFHVVEYMLKQYAK